MNNQRHSLKRFYINGLDEFQTGLCSFESLALFILEYRRKIAPYDPLLDRWLFDVAPSCVYPQRLNFSTKTLEFECFFHDCKIFVENKIDLICHYRDEHFFDIPLFVFGPTQYLPCFLCKKIFTTDSQMDFHKASSEHQARIGQPTSNYSKIVGKHFEHLILETNLWNSLK